MNARFRLTTALPSALLALAALTFIPAAPEAWSQQSSDTAQQKAPPKVLMNMRDADIRALIQWVADQTGRNIIVHRDVQGVVNVVSTQPLTPDEIYRVFLSVLQVNGFAAVETPEALKVVPANLAVQSGVPLAAVGGDMVVQVIRVQNIAAADLAEMLKPLMSKEGVINSYPGTNTLVIADHKRQLATFQGLIKSLDRAGDAEVEVLRLQHANARDVVQSLSALYPNTNGEDALGLQLSMDERSNSVLVAGDAVRRKEVRQLVRQLDRAIEGDGNTQVVYLNYIDADEVAPIIKSIALSIKKEQKEEDTGGISIEASKAANALVINAPPALLSTLRRVVEQLDIRRAQVLVEAVVVEVSGEIADDIGVSWITTDAEDLNDNAGFGAVNTLGDLGVGNIITDENGNFRSFVPGKGVTLGYFEKGNLQAAIRALKSTTRANILSTPSIVALDNEEASILVGQNVPFISGQATGSASSTENPFTTIERKDIGIELKVTPRINQGDAITLDIQQTVENIAPSVDDASDLVTNKREIITKALIKDGQILVLGGLISDDQSETHEKVPILGDLPLIGKLFSGSGKNRTKNNLMVFIHPQILKDESHVADITQRRYQFMKELQEDWNRPREERKPPGPNVLPEFERYRPAESR